MSKHNEWKKSKTIYWKDELHDDFDELVLSRPSVPQNYKYIRSNPINNFFSPSDKLLPPNLANSYSMYSL